MGFPARDIYPDEDENLESIRLSLKEALDAFTDSLENLHNNPNLASDTPFLTHFQRVAINLIASSKLAKESLQVSENLSDAVEIIGNVLKEPLSLPKSSHEVSLMEAAESFDPRSAEDSDLRKIAYALLAYPEPTYLLLQELKLVSKDLESTV